MMMPLIEILFKKTFCILTYGGSLLIVWDQICNLYLVVILTLGRANISQNLQLLLSLGYFWWILPWPAVIFGLHMLLPGLPFLCFESGQKLKGVGSWELNPLMTVLSVIQELHLPERTKNTMWPEKLVWNSGSSVTMEKWDMDFKGPSLCWKK